MPLFSKSKSYLCCCILLLYNATGEHLPLVTELIQMYDTSGPTIVLRRYELDVNGNYRNVLRRIKNSGDTSFVVVGSLATMPDLFQQVTKVYLSF